MNKFQSKIGAKGIFILISVIIITIIVDTSIVKISAITGGLSSADSSIIIFSVTGLIFAVGQYLIIGFVRKLDDKKNAITRLRLTVISRSILVIQYVFIAIFALLILQILFTAVITFIRDKKNRWPNRAGEDAENQALHAQRCFGFRKEKGQS